MPKIYILQHSDAKFSGYIHGVNFFEGRGSTSSEMDRNFLVAPPERAGKPHKSLKACKDITEECEKKKKDAEKMAKAREAKEEKKPKAKSKSKKSE